MSGLRKTTKDSEPLANTLMSNYISAGKVGGLNLFLEGLDGFTLTSAKRVGNNLILSIGATKAPRASGGNKAMMKLEKRF